jgi:hypothetical protein
MQNFITRPTAALLKRLCICLIVVNLAACSVARLGYSNGETLSYWWLNGYVDFDSSQRAMVGQRLDKLFIWHRQTQLRDYVQLLASAQRRLQHEVSKTDVLADYDELTKRGDRIIEEVAPDLADLALSMNADNFERLQKKFTSNNDDYRKHYLRGDEQEREEYRFKKTMELAEYWFGDFSDAQEAVIRRASDQRPLNNEMWLAARQQRQQTLIALLKRIQLEKPSRDAVAGMLKAYVSSNYVLGSNGTPEMKAFFEASKDGVAQLAVVIINIATPEQKVHATEKLQQWIDDFSSLAGKT